MGKSLSEFIIDINRDWDRSKDPFVEGLAYDSREVRPGWLFFALTGLHVNGHDYIDTAIDSGAIVIVHSEEIQQPRDGVVYIRVPDARIVMSPMASAFYGFPSRELGVIGVTGTEGKSSTVYFTYQLLELLGHPTGFISTVQYKAGDAEINNPEHQTTPEATRIHQLLAEMRDNGKEFAVIEASSHGLSQRLNRLGDVAFDSGIMTNVTSEHLEFHGTLEQYRHDKANLFRSLSRHSHYKNIHGFRVELPSFGVINADDKSSALFRESTSHPVYSYSAKSDLGDLVISEIRGDSTGNDFTLREGANIHEARINIPGAFNVENAVASALTVSKILRKPLGEIIEKLPLLKGVKGRMNAINRGQPFSVIIDYAHTPSSFLAIMPNMRKETRGKLICVFGSGGERDLVKRPEQGRIASDYCDIVILADEDPRNEDPVELLEMIASGCPEKTRGESLFIIPDRAKAIRFAFGLAKADDAVLLLGKGHERTIIYKIKTIPYDETETAIEALSELGYSENR